MMMMMMNPRVTVYSVDSNMYVHVCVHVIVL